MKWWPLIPRELQTENPDLGGYVVPQRAGIELDRGVNSFDTGREIVWGQIPPQRVLINFTRIPPNPAFSPSLCEAAAAVTQL